MAAFPLLRRAIKAGSLATAETCVRWNCSRLSSLRSCQPRGLADMAPGFTISLEKKKLPLFPLDVVYFPGQVFPLRIFEPRYKVLFSQIMGESSASEDFVNDGVFGVVCNIPKEDLDKADDGLTDWKSYNLGTLVQVGECLQMENGELLVTCTSLTRMRASSPERELLGYWTSESELLPPMTKVPEESKEIAEKAIHQCKQAYEAFINLQILKHSDEEINDLLAIMDAHSECPEQFSNWLAARLPVHIRTKQNLLENNDPLWRLLKISNSFGKLVQKYSSIEGSTE